MLKLTEKLQWACLPLGMLMFSNSSAFEEIGKTSADLNGVEMPASRVVGSKRIFLRNGEEGNATVTSIGDGAVGSKTDLGCEYSEPLFANNHPALSPSLSWGNCSGSSGHAKVKVKGELFPISKGNKIVYSIAGTTTKGSWTGDWKDRRVCKTKNQVRIKTAGGEYDTWKIVCNGTRDKRTFYYSPELGEVAAMKRKHFKNKSRNRTSEWLRAE